MFLQFLLLDSIRSRKQDWFTELLQHLGKAVTSRLFNLKTAVIDQLLSKGVLTSECGYVLVDVVPMAGSQTLQLTDKACNHVVDTLCHLGDVFRQRYWLMERFDDIGEINHVMAFVGSPTRTVLAAAGQSKG